MKLILNFLNLALLVLFSVALVSGIHLGREPSKLGAHLGWVLTAMLLWLLTVVLYMMYLYRMEKFCVELVEKYEGESSSSQKTLAENKAE